MSLISFLLYLLHFWTTSAQVATCACNTPSVTRRGWDIEYYHFPEVGFPDNTTFYVDGYKDFGGLYSTATGYTSSINYPRRNSDQKLYPLYGVPITTYNFTVVLTGYFLAPETGRYTATMIADDGAAVQFGEGSTCSEELNIDVHTCGIAQEGRAG
ncbi:hypothetical protein DASB73_043420 [Starmerella bacillaris]|uniref:PA14 domain-containing protein n=1 Tax=Starmerella bacillaris TaxID=1247836 RepID=A0AAV5RP83_STABA|nr:hypothetical protein DASB73_043420 [Starmerella bacillaris]